MAEIGVWREPGLDKQYRKTPIIPGCEVTRCYTSMEDGNLVVQVFGAKTAEVEMQAVRQAIAWQNVRAAQIIRGKGFGRYIIECQGGE